MHEILCMKMLPAAACLILCTCITFTLLPPAAHDVQWTSGSAPSEAERRHRRAAFISCGSAES